MLAGGAFGLVSALVYLLVGHWLPRSGWRRRLAFAGLLVALVGGLLIDPNNRDFTELEPRLLNVAMFAMLPVPFALVLPGAVEWLARLRLPRVLAVGAALVGWSGLAMVTVMVGLGGPGLTVVAAVAVLLAIFGTLAAGRRPAWLGGQAVMISGRTVIVAVAVAAFVGLVRDAARIVTA